MGARSKWGVNYPGFGGSIGPARLSCWSSGSLHSMPCRKMRTDVLLSFLLQASEQPLPSMWLRTGRLLV